MSSRLLAALTLAVIDVTFRVWSKAESADIVMIADDVLATLSGLVVELPAAPRTRRRPRRSAEASVIERFNRRRHV